MSPLGCAAAGGLALLGVLIASACNPPEPAAAARKPAVRAEPAVDLALLAAQRRRGAVVFTELCAGCHDSSGRGGGNFPPLDGSEFVQGDPQRLAFIVHKGAFGPITVRGRTYGGDIMGSWEDQLDAPRTAVLLTYLRSSWSNRTALAPAEQLVTAEQAAAWIEAARGVKGPLPARIYESGEWRELTGSGAPHPSDPSPPP